MKNLNSLGRNLGEISVRVLHLLQTVPTEDLIDESTRNKFRNNWERVDIKSSWFESWRHVLAQDGGDLNDLAVEIISTTDTDSEIHFHKNAYALVTILGERERVQNPDNCVFYFGSKDIAYPAVTGITLHILPNIVHGFRSLNGTNAITFLSVQSKRINEDFYPV